MISASAFAKFNQGTGEAQVGDLYCISQDARSSNLLIISDIVSGEPTRMELIRSTCGAWEVLADASVEQVKVFNQAVNSAGGPGAKSMIYSGQSFDVYHDKVSSMGETTQSAVLEVDLAAGAFTESFNCKTVN
jgi:hypothetical protein